jgi:hypothetical protein
MKNKLLTITRGSIPYIKELRPKVKSVTACILMQQLDYWFNKYPNGFGKLLEPIESDRENNHDKNFLSWVEELGFSAEEFKTAFSNIGVSYKSKTEFEQAQNKFLSQDGKEKFYCAYYDRQERMTYYFRNHQLVDNFLDSLTETSQSPETDNPGFLENYKSSPRNRQSRFLEPTTPVSQKPTIPVSSLNDLKIKEKDYIKEENKEEDTSLSLSDFSNTHTVNFSSPEEKKESTKEISSKEKPCSTKSVSDNRAKHPAIVAVRAILGRFPNKLLWDEIIQILGDTPDLDKLRNCAKEWAKKTSNMGNMVWLFEWYKNGIPLSVYAANQIKENQQSQQPNQQKPIRGKAAFDIAAQRFLERKAREAKENEGQQHL